MGDIGPLQSANDQQKQGHCASVDLSGADGWRTLCNGSDKRLIELLTIWANADDRQRSTILTFAARQAEQ